MSGYPGTNRMTSQPLAIAGRISPSPDSRVEFETLISDASTRLMIAPVDGVDAAIETVLGQAREFFRADGCGLLAVSADGTSLATTHAAAPGANDVNVLERCPWAGAALLVSRVPVVVSRMSDLPAEAGADREHWQATGKRSVAAVPVFSGTTVSHVVALHSVGEERQWPRDLPLRLRLVGELIASVLRPRPAAADSLGAKRLHNRLERENACLRSDMAYAADGDVVAGRSPRLRRTLSLAEQVAATNSTVLLLGETGTGKERFAAYIHGASPRRDRPMVRVNCSAIPAALIESELFGRERGAYTGALSRQIGRFELASGSTLFLDEIGDLPLDIQVKLLNVLQDRVIARLGSPTPIPVDIRIIAATNRDLDAAIRDGTFRSDLYYRLNVFPIVVPPLRERREDIPLLVHQLVAELGGAMRKRFSGVDQASLDALVSYDWPGNVRELRNLLERAMILARGPILSVAPPAERFDSPARPDATPGLDLRSVEREHIVRVLNSTGWRIRGKNAAAEVLGLKPTTLEARMAKLRICRPGTPRAN